MKCNAVTFLQDNMGRDSKAKQAHATSKGTRKRSADGPDPCAPHASNASRWHEMRTHQACRRSTAHSHARPTTSTAGTQGRPGADQQKHKKRGNRIDRGITQDQVARLAVAEHCIVAMCCALKGLTAPLRKMKQQLHCPAAAVPMRDKPRAWGAGPAPPGSGRDRQQPVCSVIE